MSALDLKKYEKLEAAKLRRERLIAEHTAALAEVDAEIAREMMILGIAPVRSAEGKVKKAGVSAAKKAYWDNLRSVATSKGYFHTTGRKQGLPDVERVRREMKTEKPKRKR